METDYMVSHVTRILVTGGDGILAQALRAYFPLATYSGRAECDVTNGSQVRSVFNDLKPELVIHCAAITAHNAEPGAYVAVNIQGTLNVALQSKKHGSEYVYMASDYFGARRESDPVHPVNGYAASKYAGEIAGALVMDGGRAISIRGSWYSSLDYTHAATDAFTTKLPVAKAAYCIATIAVSSATGIVNIGGGRRSLYEIALEQNEQVIPTSRHHLRRVLGLDYDIPADCSLDTTRLRSLVA